MINKFIIVVASMRTNYELVHDLKFNLQILIDLCNNHLREKKKKKIQNYEMLKSKHRKKNQTYRFFYGINSRMTSSH